jgi:hypothetical protein
MKNIAIAFSQLDEPAFDMDAMRGTDIMSDFIDAHPIEDIVIATSRAIPTKENTITRFDT